MKRRAVLLIILVFAACQQPATQSEKPFTYTIDPGLTPVPDSLPDTGQGPRPLAATQDEDGVVSVFIANEVILEPKGQAELDAFLARYGGTVIGSDEIPEPPARTAITLTPEERQATEYTIRLDPASFPLDTFSADGEAAGFGGARQVSSEAAARLLAIMMRERKNGAEVSPNYVYEPHGVMLFKTEDHPGGNSFRNAFNWAGLKFNSDMTGSQSSVLKAWQFLAALGELESSVNVAIIDGGFWLGQQGQSVSILPSGVTDFPDVPLQHDFVDHDGLAGGPNPSNCTGGSPCPWHGNNSASVATGRPDNRYGAAGTGGWVADPILFKTDYTRSQVRAAVKTAVAWHAAVVSMSFGGACNLDCDLFMSSTYTAFVKAQQAGVVLVASAGNDNLNVDNTPKFPCNVAAFGTTPGVLCVGALADGANTRISYSNYGKAVDIFAPTNIASTPNPSTQAANPPLDSAGGTSASAPFVAGVVAMMKAVDAAITPAQVDKILKDTAWTDSSDARVTRYINAYKAVREAANNNLPPDALEPNDSPAAAKPLELGSLHEGLTIVPDSDYYTFTLEDYAMVEFDLTYMKALSELSLFLLGAGTANPPINETVTPHSAGTDEGKTVSEALMAPGTYTFGVSGSDLNLYHLSLSATPTPLQPDQFEVNDTLATAATPPDGSYSVSLHTATDEDFYSFTLSAPLPKNLEVFRFDVTFSDQPLSLQLFKDGVEQSLWPPATTHKLALGEAGTYTVRLKGSSITRYGFKLGKSVSEAVLPKEFPVPVDDFWFIDPTQTSIHWLIGERDGFAFIQSERNLIAYDGLELPADGLHLTLYNASGETVAEGESLSGRVPTPGERLPFENTRAGETYFLTVERTNLPAVQGALLPILEYSLRWKTF